MIKVVFCLRKLSSLTLEEFSEYWLKRHGPLVRECADAVKMIHYTQSHLISDQNLLRAGEVRGCSVEPFDGVAEVWWKSLAELKSVSTTPEGRDASRRLLADEKLFIDLSRSSYFYCEEHIVFSTPSREITQ